MKTSGGQNIINSSLKDLT